MMGYTLIYFLVALIMAFSGAFALYFSWRCVENKLVTSRAVPIALVSGFIFWFFLALILVLAVDVWRNLAIRFLGGNGFSFAILFAMVMVLCQHQLLVWLRRK